MPFFDDFSKRISKAGQTAIQKTRDMAEIAKISSAISDEERNINDLYFQIGKKYVSSHSETAEPIYTEMIMSLKEKEKRIKELQKQMQEIKGVVRCDQCGAEVPAGAAFCSSCGSAIPKAETAVSDNADEIKCEHCGAMIKRGLRFCTSCGNPVDSTPIPAETPVETVAERVCPNCGAKIEDNTAFCTECGTKM